MPDLPTLTVTATQAQRILATFGSSLEYRKWLRQSIVNHVTAREAEAKNAADRAAFEAEIPTPTA
jgi:hypothetical protein